MKNHAKLMCLLVTLSTLAGCSGGGSKDTITLDAYLYSAGYGSDFADVLGESFASQDWVKEKYGKVKVNWKEKNKEESFAEGQIEAQSQKFDIYIGMNLQSLIGKKGSNRKYYLEDLSDVYESQVPGEDVKFSEKMISTVVTANKAELSDGTSAFYTVPWAGGFNGIMYNPDVLSKYNVDVPVTTDELVASMKTITKGEGKAIIQGCDDPGSCYWQYLFPTWWGQYEGLEGWMNFWHGKVHTEDADYSSVDIFKQQGRLESLRVLESIMASYDNGSGTVNNFDETCNGIDYMTAQTSFLKGGYAYMACGDWFDYEMSLYKSSSKKDLAEVSMMKNPVISAIIDVLPDKSVTDDARLSAVVKAIDAGNTSYEGVTANDFAKIAEARQMAYSAGNYHSAVIPTCSDQIELGKDFLRFLATDEANKIYSENTCGAGLPFHYNMKTSDPDYYAAVSGTARMRNDLYNDTNNEAIILPTPNNFRLHRDGQVGLLSWTSASKFELFYRQSNPYTAQEFYDKDIAYWDEQAWAMLLRRLGVNQ